MEIKKFEILNSQSNIGWIGRKITGAHNGSIAIKDGTLMLDDGKLAGGKFIIDTTSIKILDITDPATNAQFAGHLASDDFFSIEQFPTACLKIISVKPEESGKYHITADLTIKDITHPVTFDVVVSVNDNLLHASASLKIDRTKYEMRFRSGNFFKDLGDTLIYNDFELNVDISAKVLA